MEGGREKESGGRKRNRKWREEEIKKVEGGRDKESGGRKRKTKCWDWEEEKEGNARG